VPLLYLDFPCLEEPKSISSFQRVMPAHFRGYYPSMCYIQAESTYICGHHLRVITSPTAREEMLFAISGRKVAISRAAVEAGISLRSLKQMYLIKSPN